MIFFCILPFLTVTPLFSKEWVYLYSKAFKSRSAVAAYYLKDCQEIIEIGGFKTPISDFVTGKIVSVIDPLIPPKQEGGVTHYPVVWREWLKEPITSCYGVLILGFHLEGMCGEDWRRLYTMVNDSKITVIEFPRDFSPSADQVNELLQNTTKHITVKINLDFSGSDLGDLTESWPPYEKRTLYVLE
jgi:hypothetical protein